MLLYRLLRERSVYEILISQWVYKHSGEINVIIANYKQWLNHLWAIKCIDHIYFSSSTSEKKLLNIIIQSWCSVVYNMDELNEKVDYD